MGPMAAAFLLLASWVGTATAQQPGRMTEQGPSISLKQCTKSGGCTSRQARVTIDANWRWVHEAGGYKNCFKDGVWDKQVCSDNQKCAEKCALEGADEHKYQSTYGVSGIQGGVRLNFLTKHKYGKNVGSRLYILAENGEDYQTFRLKNREFSIQVDSSRLECGMNGAAYFVEMDPSGGRGRNQNKAGARFGTGYCDAQCPHDVKFIGGEANAEGWRPNPKDPSGNMGLGNYGACCAEMDIWEANKMATAFTPHPCKLEEAGQFKCKGKECGDNDKNQRYEGVCDKDGCDKNPYRMGNHSFYGPGPDFVVDSSKPVTVVTQFLTSDGTDDGELSAIRRFYVQGGKTVFSPPATILDLGDHGTITDGYCTDNKKRFNDTDDFTAKGGLKQMGKSLERGHVLALSLWDDFEANMLWLDSADPPEKDRTQPGVLRGPCPGGESSTPAYVREHFPDAYVAYSNVAIGEIGSTTGAKDAAIVYP